MRRFVAPAVVVIAAVLAQGCTQGEIKGQIIVGPTSGGQVVYAALWSVPSQSSGSGDGLVAQANAAPSPAGSTPIGTAPPGGGTFSYSFTDLNKGLYLVGAYLDTVNDMNPNIVGLVHTIDSTPLEVDPGSKSLALVSQNIYLAESAPGTGTIRGTLHTNSAAAAVPDAVYVLDGSLLASTLPNVIDEQQLSGTSSIPYAIFNLPLQPLYVFGDADIGDDGNLDNDLLAFPQTSPVTLSKTQPEVDGVDLWLGAQNPAEGSISGQIELSQTLDSGTTANVQLYAQAGGYDASAPLVALVNVPVTGSSASFTMPSVPYGSLYLSTGVQVTIDGQSLTGSSYYPGPPNPPGPITLNSDTPNATAITIPVGLNEVTGNVTLTGVPATVGAVWVVASITVNNNPFVVAGDLLAVSGPGSPAPFAYTIFGLWNSTYQLDLIPAADTQTSLQAAIAANSNSFYPGSPAQVTFDGSARETSDFTVAF